MWYTELIGIIGSALVLLSMTIKSSTMKGNITMRTINLIGSIIFIAYGLMIPAWSTAIMNMAAAIVNATYLIRLTNELKNTN